MFKKILSSNIKTRIASTVLVLPMLAGMQACTDEELGVAIGAASIGAGAVIIGSSIDRDRGHNGRERNGRYVCRGGYRNACESYRDYNGRYRRSCRNVYDSCANREWRNYRYYSSIKAENVSGNLNTDVSTFDWATTFYMSQAASQKLVAALKEARNGSPATLHAMGLAPKDMQRLVKFKMPSNAGVDALAKSLNQQRAYTKQMLQKLLNEAKALRSS